MLDLKIILGGDEPKSRERVVQETVAMLRRRGIPMWGYLTEETEDASGTGYQVETFDGLRINFAHVLMRRGPRVGPYRVDVRAFEGAVMSRLSPRSVPANRRERCVGIIHQVGRLETLSRDLSERIEQLLKQDVRMLISITNEQAVGLADRIRRQMDEHLVEVTEQNINLLPTALADTLALYSTA